MTLNSLLEQQRRRRSARLQRAREADHRRRLAAGLPLRTSNRDQIELLAAALTGSLFLEDLDRLLAARSASLWLVWKRNIGELYTESPDGTEVLMRLNTKKGLLQVCYQGDMGRRIAHFLDLHQVEMMIGMVGGRMVLQCGSREVSDTHCLRLIETTQNRKCRYMPAASSTTSNQTGAA